MTPAHEGARRNARRKAFELLFELEQHPGVDPQQILERSFADPDVLEAYCRDEDEDGYVLVEAEEDKGSSLYRMRPRGRKMQQFVSELVLAAKEHEAAIDAELAKHPHDWSFDRIGTAERVLMRLAVAEMAYLGTAHKVVINEVLDLAKQYAQADAVKFINGILGAVVRNLPLLGESAADKGDAPERPDSAGPEAEND
ncbi:transcription antitermination factor NusB [bacterium]|nr:transcription antitermination factor NusB [bacterium]